MSGREPTDAEVAKFKRAAKALADLGRKGLYLYLANDSLHLMTGPSHGEAPHNTEGLGSARQDRIRASVRIPGAGGGDW